MEATITEPVQLKEIMLKLIQLESAFQLLSNEFEEYKHSTDAKITKLQNDQREKSQIIKAQNEIIEHLTEPKVIEVKYTTKDLSIHPPTQGGDDPRNVGYDIWAEQLVSKSKNVRKYAAYISWEPPPGYYLEIQERSSFRLKHPGWVGAIGTIDGGYRGYVHIVMTKVSVDAEKLPKRFCCFQVIARPEILIKWTRVDKLSKSIRGENGFGSTDEKLDAI